MRLLRTLRFRVILLVVGVALMATTMALWAARYNAEQAIWRQVDSSGELVGAIIAESIALSRELPDELEAGLDEDLASTARLLSEFVALAERTRMPRQTLQQVLEGLVEDLGVAEIWITESTGRVEYSVPRDAVFTFHPDPKVQPQASAFWPLLTGEKKRVVQPTRPRDLDGRMFKYVGVAGVDRPRIVQIGVSQDEVLALRSRLSLARLSEILQREGVLSRPLLVVDGQLQPVQEAALSVREAAVKTESLPPADLAPQQRQALEQALLTRLMVTRLEPDAAVIYRTYQTHDGRHQGAFAAGFPRHDIDQNLKRQQRLILWVGLTAVVAASVLGWLASLRLTRRLSRITAVARAIRRGKFERLDELQPDLAATDEVGVLGQIVHAMGQEVRDRQAVLEEQVRVRTHELAERNVALAAAQAMINHELDLAKRLQLGILPAAFPNCPGWHGAARIRMQQQMGGDFYDFIERRDGTLALVMADVSGKGIAAAFFMAMARTSLLHHLGQGLGPAQSLAAANDELCRSNPLDLFVTVFVAVLDPATGHIEHANAGHNPPVHRRQDGTVVEWSCPGDLALGVMPDFPYTTAQTSLAPGEQLLAYTDGVTEAFDVGGQAYGVERLLRWMSNSTAGLQAQAWVDGLFADVMSFQGSAAQADDITVTVIVRDIEQG